MKVKLNKENNVKIAVIAAIENDLDLLKKVIDSRKEDSEGYDDIVFSINGVELNFNNFINNFAKEWNQIVETRAIEILNEKYENLLRPIMDIQEELDIQKRIIERKTYNN